MYQKEYHMAAYSNVNDDDDDGDDDMMTII